MVSRRFILLVAICAGWGCGSEPSAEDVRNDQALKAAASIGVPSSPSADLLKEMSKGQPAVDLTDSAKNERNARMLPEVMKNSNDAIAKIENGGDASKAVQDLQKQNASMGLGH